MTKSRLVHAPSIHTWQRKPVGAPHFPSSHAEIEQALKPFKQINALKRGRGDGTGLGLPLTKAMVDANRAVFSINSAPNEGTLVEITFPSQRVLAG